jgi:hypothetical protein
MQELLAISFTVPYLIPPTVNHYKEPCVYIGKDGARHLGFKVTKATRAYYDAVCIFAHGETVAPRGSYQRERTVYRVEMHVYLGKNQRGDADNFNKTGIDSLCHAGVIHSDAAVETCIVTVHKEERGNPRTVYHVTRLEKQPNGTN